LNTDNLISNIIEGIENVKGVNVNILDLREIENVACQYFIVCTGNSSTQVNAITNSVNQYFIVCTGNSSTQVNAITNSVKKCVSKSMSEKPWHVEGLENCKWVLMDYVDVVLHIFNEETREYYKIEELWEEATSTLVETKY